MCREERKWKLMDARKARDYHYETHDETVKTNNKHNNNEYSVFARVFHEICLFNRAWKISLHTVPCTYTYSALYTILCHKWDNA